MIKRLFQQVKDSRKLFLISVIFGCIGGLVLITEAFYVARIVDQVFLKGSGLHQVMTLLMILLAVIIVRALLHMVSEFTAAKLAQGIKSELRVQLIGKLGKLGPQYSKQERSGKLVSTLYEGVEQLENYLSSYVPQIVLSMFVPFAVFVVVIGQDGLSALVYAITLPLLIIFMILIGKYTKVRTDRQYKLLGRLGGHFQEILRGIETLKVFNRSKDQLRIIGAISEQHRRSTMATLRLAFLSAFVMELFATLSTAVIAVFLGLRLVNGQLEFYHAFLILLLTPEFYAPIRALGTQFHAGMNGASAATRIFQILDTEPKGLVEHNGEKPSVNERGATIEFQGVTLQHEGYAEPALDGVSFKLEEGARLAIVGATGAGKSTILDLLQGFLKPTSGSILINGKNVQELSVDEWRKCITAVSQVTHLFHGTVRENIAIGLDGATDAQLWDALRRAGAEGFVKQLPQGLHSKLTDKIKLSGGQIQRLALARALLRQDSSIVLLDEATTGLDAYHEQHVLSELEKWMSNKTCIIVAHHLQTVAAVDMVVVLDQGKVIEVGSPLQLAAAKGKFAAMLEAMKASGVNTDAYIYNKSLYVENLQTDSSYLENIQTNLAHPEYCNQLQHQAKRDAENIQQYETISTEPSASEDRRATSKEHRDREAAEAGWSLFISSSRRLMKFMAPYKWLAFIAVMLSFFTIAANIGLMGTSGYLIAKAALRPENVLMLYVPIVGVRFFGISRGVFRYLERLASHNVTFKVLHRLRVWLYARIEPDGVTLFGRKRSGNVLGSVISDIDQLQHFYLRLFAPPVVFIMTIMVSVLFMSFQHVALAVTLLVLLLAAGIAIPYSSYVKSKKRASALVEARVKLYEDTMDLLQGLSTLQQFGKFKQQQQKLEQVQQELNRHQLKEHRNRAISNGLMTGMTQLGMWVMLLITIPLIVNGSIAPYMLPAILLITLASFEAAAPLPQAFQMSSSVSIAANRLFKLADEQEMLMEQKKKQENHNDESRKQDYEAEAHRTEAQQEQQGQREVVKLVNSENKLVVSGKAIDNKTRSDAAENLEDGRAHDISERSNSWSCELENVVFTYEDATTPALKGINLALETGKQMAVVGESGAGKSTLLQAMLKLRSIESGNIAINGQNYEQLSEDEVRGHFAVVSQQVQLFNATVAENLRLGNRQASDEQLAAAAKLAEIHDFIMSLPEGYHTMIGEYGAKLSGGQRQRLALARALVRDGDALLFDEPATGLDPLTQKAFQHNLQDALQQRALLWITHRLADVVMMDEIIVIKQGEIVERGTHEQLLAKCGYYAQLWVLERAKDWNAAS